MLGYLAALHAKDVNVMARYSTKKMRKELDHVTKNRHVLTILKYPSFVEIVMLYAKAWIPKCTAQHKHLIELFETELGRLDQCRGHEPRDVAAGLLWKLVQPMAMFIDGVRITQRALGNISGSKPSTFVALSLKL